ncbi:uncharacterized protein LOC112271043 [Brachypodium distachyon]|nr:uncharacterized protein LOC112271043 [Brachypodium distachyon]|eukprot:XP_024315715.1 uncharacterized protein LOC112271043 [Brachypodium distachyon]
MGSGRRRRPRKNAQSKSTTEDKVDAIPDELLCLVFLRLTSPVDLVRAAFTCRRWRRVIAADAFRVVGSQHGAPPPHAVGHYRVEEPGGGYFAAARPPGRSPVFVPSSSSPWKDVVAAAAGFFALDFLPRTRYGEFNWELADVRGGLVLVMEFSDKLGCAPLKGLAICDPLARRYKKIPSSAWFHGRCCFMGCFLLDGEDDAGAPISLSNFRVTCVLFCDGVAKAYAFSPAAGAGGRWTSPAAARGSSTARCGNDYWMATVPISFAGSTGGSAYWKIENGRVVALNKETAELSSSVLPNALRGKRPSLDYAFEFPWPPTIRPTGL